MTKLILTNAARIDVLEISNWYEIRTPGTGERLLLALDEKFESICGNPEIHRQISETGIRKSKLEKWPYQVFFVFSDQLIEVIAIIHTSRDPGYISKRTS